MEILDIKSPDDWLTRANFLPVLHGTVDDLDRIVGRYDLPRPVAGSPHGTGMVHCGLNGCDRLHYKGFLIRFKNGRETIVGRDCSREKIGSDWDEIEATFVATETTLARQKVLQELQSSKFAILADAKKLAPRCKEAHDLLKGAVAELSAFNGFWKALENVARLDGSVKVEAEKTEMTERSGTVVLEEAARVRNCGLFFLDTTPYLRALHVDVIHWLEFELTTEIVSAGDDLKKLAVLTVKAAALREHLRNANVFLNDAHSLLDATNLAGLQVIASKQLSSSQRSNRLQRALTRLSTGLYSPKEQG